MRKLFVLGAALCVAGCDELFEPLLPTDGGATPTASLNGTVTVFQGAGQSARGAVDPRSRALAKKLFAAAKPAAPAVVARTADDAAPKAPRWLGPIKVGQLRGVGLPSEVRVGEAIVRFDAPLDQKAATARLQLNGYRVTHGGFASPTLQLARITKPDGATLNEAETLAVVDRLGKVRGVRWAEANRMRHALAVPNDSLYPAMWHLPPINAPAAWDLEKGTTNQVTVAVIDTGIISHPDLNARVVAGYDMVSDVSNANDGDARDNNPDDPGGDLPQNQSSWHGTHCAGTIGASTDNGSGIAGLNWNARIVPVRVLGKRGGSDFDILAGMNWASGGTVPGVPANANPASVINMSLGGPGQVSQSYQDIIDEAAGRNAIFVIAAGNDDVDASGFVPCAQQRVLCIGATKPNGRRASYSNFGARVDLMAPGGEVSEDSNGDGYADGVLSTLKGENGQPTYSFENGTSMAAPHITGVVSLMKARNPALTFTQARQVLIDTAQASSKCNEGCGAGLVNVQAALLRLTNSQPTGPATLSINTPSLFFTPSTTNQNVMLSNTGGGTLNITLTPSGAQASRVTVQGGNTRNVGPGETTSVSVQADLSGLGADTASAVLNIASNGGDGTVGIKLRSASASGPDVAVAAVYEDSAGEWQVQAAVWAQASSGFTFSIPVPAGEFWLFGVQDSNGNGDFDDGEPIGLYPNNADPRTVTVRDGDAPQGLDFAVAPTGNVTGEESTYIGRACTDDPGCGGGGAYCVESFPGGYCAALCDTTPCPIGATCIEASTASVCLSACSAPRGGQSSCRAGYICDHDGSGGGVCLPACTGDGDCAPDTCNLGTGYCE